MKPEGGPLRPGAEGAGLGEGHGLGIHGGGHEVRSGAGACLGGARGGPGTRVQRRGGGYKPGGAGADLSQCSPTSRVRQQSTRRLSHSERHRKGPVAALEPPTPRPPPPQAERPVPGVAPPPAARAGYRTKAAPRPGCARAARVGPELESPQPGATEVGAQNARAAVRRAEQGKEAHF